MSKILVVDDDRAIRRLYDLILGVAGFKEVEFVSNGKDAVDRYKNSAEHPEIIIMDHRMPIMNGIDAMIEILQVDKSVKIIFSSADATVKEQAISKGAVAFLNKPFDIQELRNTIKNVLNEVIV